MLDRPGSIRREGDQPQIKTMRQSIDYPLNSLDSKDDPVKRDTNWNFQPTPGITYEMKPVGKNQIMVNQRIYEKAATLRGDDDDDAVPSPMIVHPNRSVRTEQCDDT